MELEANAHSKEAKERQDIRFILLFDLKNEDVKINIWK